MNSTILDIVFDTNVVVSATLKPRSIPSYLVSAALSQKIRACYSREVLAEYRDVLTRGKFQFEANLVRILLAEFRKKGKEVFPEISLTVCSDPADNKFLECAQAAQALYLITGNRRHFPENYGVTTIVSPQQAILILITSGIL